MVGDFMKKKTSVRTKFIRTATKAAMPALQVLCAPPKLEHIKKALFIQPHPDDNQIGAGGTIAYLVSKGIEVYELTVLDDRYTDLSFSGEGYTVRQKEALEAQEKLGMKKLNDKQKIYVELNKQDYIESATDDVVLNNNQNIFQKIIEKIKNIF